MDRVFENLVDQLRSGNLVAFLGAGVSRAYLDQDTKRQWPGLPTAGDIVGHLAKSRPSYISSDMPFDQACYLVKKYSGRAELEKVLSELIDRPTLEPLPAHTLLSHLSFTCFVTTNYDQLLERALASARKSYDVIIGDDDVARWRSSNIPVIKIHGCVSSPSTMLAADDDILPLGAKAPIAEALLRVQMSNRSLLILGFQLADPDFMTLYRDVSNAMGERMPKSYAVTLGLSNYWKEYWSDHGIEVIEMDLTGFLRTLLRRTATAQLPAVYLRKEDWINNTFFQSLHTIRNLPSETQVIDAFLDHLLDEIRSPGISIGDVVVRAKQASSLVMTQRPNFEALRTVAEDVVQSIETECDSKDKAELEVSRVLGERHAVENRISAKGAEVIKRGDSVLLFSQSRRVLQLLRGVPRGVQDSCQLFIAECRPKSPTAFQDGLAMSEALQGTGYQVTLIPDVAVGNLMARRQIHKVILGAHAVYTVEGEYVGFVNTCGSDTIVKLGEHYDIPTTVVAEKAKIKERPSDINLEEISFDQEEEVFGGIESVVSEIQSHGLNIGTLNVGYDYCEFGKATYVVTD